MTTTTPTRPSGSTWHTVTVRASDLSREVERLRNRGAVITSSRRTAGSYVLAYVV